MIEWEDSTCTPVNLKWIVGNAGIPDVGDNVAVKEPRTKNVYRGTVLKKGKILYSLQCCVYNSYNDYYSDIAL